METAGVGTEAQPQYTVANAKVTFTGEIRDIEVNNLAGKAEIALLETTDGLRAEISVQKFVDGSAIVRLTEFLSTPPPTYSHLIRNGSMTVQTRTTDGKKVALLRALRPGGKEYPTLNAITIDELTLLLGEDFEQWLKNLHVDLGVWSQINPAAGKFKDVLAVAVDEYSMNLLVLPWTLTRVIALMKKLGRPTLESN